MSRIGRKPVAIPAGTDVSIADGNVVTVKGKLGTLTQALSSRMIIKKDGDVINVSRPSDEKKTALFTVSQGRLSIIWLSV